MIFVHTLGTASIDVGSCSITPTSPRKFALLLHLSVERGRRVPRSWLQQLIFAGQAERNARHSLRELVYQLRQVGVPLDIGADGLRLDGNAVCADYDYLLSGQPIEPSDVQAAASGFLPGYEPTHSEAFAEWYEGYRAHSISAINRALLKEINRARDAGDWGATERAARVCLGLDPLNEEATLALAEMLALGGAKAQAVKLLDAYMGEVGRMSPDLRLPARILRRRIDQNPDAGPSRFAPRFVGRSTQMSTLRSLLRSTLGDENHCIVVSGEPGIGKSRLLEEFRSIAELEGVRCQRVAMQPHDASRPVGAFVDLVPGLLQLPGALGCSPESMQALKRLVGDESVTSSGHRNSIELEATALAMTSAIGDLCDAIAAEVPLALIIEDAHSLDDLSIRTLAAIISSRRRSRIIVLLSTREPRTLLRTIRHSDRVHHLHLPPLLSDATAALIEELLSRSMTQATPYVCERLVELANGNPLFAILLAAHYTDTGDSGGVPPTLIESLTRRLDALPRMSLSVLTTCVALGKHCTTDRLLRALEITPIALLEIVADLTDAGMLDSRTDQIAASHPLVADAIARQVSPSIRSTVNFRVAEVFERDAINLTSSALWWEAATRWQDAGEADRAIGAYRKCARHAMEIGRAGDAARILDAALRLPGMPESRMAAAKELVIAADRSSDSELVFRGREVLRCTNSGCVHDELELAERRALLRSARMPEGLLEMTRECIRAPEASIAHRVEAATIALKCAEIFGTGQKAVELIEQELSTADVVAVGSLTRFEFELLLRSAREDRAGAADIAMAMHGQIERDSSIDALTPGINCGIALFLAGRLQPAISVLEQGYQRAIDTRSLGHQLRIAMVLANMYDDLSDDRNGDLWLSRATDLALQNPELMPNFDLIIMRMMRAFAAGDLMTVEFLVEEAEHSGMFDDGTVRRRWGRAIRLLLAARKGSIDSEQENLARSIFRDSVSSMHGYRDVEVAAAVTILAANHSHEAMSLAQAYIAKERASRGPLSRPLSEAIHQLGNRAAELLPIE